MHDVRKTWSTLASNAPRFGCPAARVRRSLQGHCTLSDKLLSCLQAWDLTGACKKNTNRSVVYLNCIPHHNIYDENAHMPQHKQLSSPVFHLALFDTPVISANRSTGPRGDGCRQWGLRKLEVGAGFRSNREAMASLILELREALNYLVGGGPGVDFGNESYPRKWRGGKNTRAGVCNSSSKPVPSQEQAIWPWANYYPSSQCPRVRVCIKIPHSSADMASSDEGSATYRM